GGGGERWGARGMHRVEFWWPAREWDADRVGRYSGVARGRVDRGRMAHVGLHGMDLADPAERLQKAGKLGAADGDANAVAEFGQRAHDVAAEETRAAEDGDERFER